MNAYIKGLKTAQLVTIFNFTREGDQRIKKFVDRATAEKRVAALFNKKDFLVVHGPRFTAHDIPLPTEAMPAHEVITDTADAKALAAVNKPKGKKKAAPKDPQKTPPHLNLRCPSCGYYAKTTPAWLKQARLVCPVDPKHGILKTAEERGERRGR